MDRRDVSVVDNVSTEKYLRIASISIAAYEYLSIIVIVVSNYGVFATTFTPESCPGFFLVAPIFKVIQTMVSQVILGVRTFNITRRSRRMGIGLLIFFVLVTTMEWFTNMYNRILSISCTPANSGPHLSAFYYLVSMLYDLGTLVISTIYLLRFNTHSGRFARLIRVMIYDGLGYFVVLTGSNVLNLILYRASDEALQRSRAYPIDSASLGYAVTWIMSQRILIHLREMSADLGDGRLDKVILTRQLHTGRDVTNALRSQFESQKSRPLDVEFGPASPGIGSANDMELDIRVHVEHSVTVDYPGPGDADSFRKPRVKWHSDPQSKA
ncbi:hypothetical protein BV22DRAFT_1033078 [Leucogyrophana mollusca]|uniref:Uncharacterized protein n=1 Tax=Leucogyrophana mollusca TaxID=85980 RepID=A0ACB8BKB3_9AGAM|nr:hypothetical protein BV22DRAFT_1033078 [Leucogyrophana mollusca]